VYQRVGGQVEGREVQGNEFFVTFRTARSADRSRPEQAAHF
jgi:hypothetical protein